MRRYPQTHPLPTHPRHQDLDRPLGKQPADGRGRAQGRIGLDGDELAGVAGEDEKLFFLRQVFLQTHNFILEIVVE